MAGPFDRADMNEHIGAAGVGLNEPEPLRRIKPRIGPDSAACTIAASASSASPPRAGSSRYRGLTQESLGAIITLQTGGFVGIGTGLGRTGRKSAP
jgi:hypothetical protein